MQVSKKRKSYNDGVAVIYAENKMRTDFNAKINANNLEQYTEICKTFYRIEAQREDDLLFAQALGKSLDLKISVPLISDIDIKHSVYVGGVMYSIYRMDPNRANGVLYLYLMGARKYA